MNLSQDLQGLKKKAKETFLYVLSALLLGIAIGAIDAVFGRVLLFITDFRSAHVVVLLPFLPLAGLGIVWLYRHFNETAAKGMTLVMEAGRESGSRFHWHSSHLSWPVHGSHICLAEVLGARALPCRSVPHFPMRLPADSTSRATAG